MTWRDRLGLVAKPSRDGKSIVGTGFWVTPNRVLTSRHVVENASSLRISPVTGGSIELAPEAILWCGSDPLDVAILAADHPEPAKLASFAFGQPIHETSRCEAAGFPRIGFEAPREKDVAGQIFDISGSLHPATAKRPTLQLSAEQDFAGVQDLAGISGAPVFVKGQLQGLIRGGPNLPHGDVLHVVSYQSLSDIPELAELLGFSTVKERFQEVKLEVAQVATTRQFIFDVFVSHSYKDKAVVVPLAERIRNRGLKVFLDDWCIGPGDDKYLALEKGLEVSQVLVFCASPNSVDSEWAQFERSTVHFANPTNEKNKRRVIPLLLADCELPSTLQRFKYIDYRKHSDAAFEVLLKACAPIVAEGAKAAESAVEEGEPTAEERKHRCDELLRLAALLLRDRMKLCSDLAQKVKTVLAHEKGAWPDSDQERLLVEIERLGTRQLLQIFLELHRKPEPDNRLDELLRLLLPVVFWTELSRYRAHITDRSMRLPLVEAAYAEIAQAAYDGRKLELFRAPDAALRSMLEIQAPTIPEAGASGSLSREDLVAYLHGELINSKFQRDPFLTKHRKSVTDYMPPEEQLRARAEIVNRLLERERQTNNRIFFLLVEKSTYVTYGREAESFIQGFRDLLPALRVVIMDGDWKRYAEETTDLEDLHEML